MASNTLNEGEIEVTHGSVEYEWKIPDYCSQEQEYKNWRIADFEFLGASWRLRLRNNPCLQLGIFTTGSEYSDRRFNYTIGIRSADGTFHKSTHGVEEVRHSDLSEQPNRSTRFVRHLSAEVAPQGVLTVFCKLSVQQEHCERTTADSTTQTEISEGIDKLRRNLKDLLSSEEDSDVLIKVGNREFRAHMTILRARSMVFASMFRHDMKERGSGTVDIPDCDPLAFEQFLLYMYTGKVDCLTPDNVCHLYQLANKYDVQDLKTNCVEYMEENISTDTFCDVISLALRHEEPELLENAIQFFMKNAEKIVITVKWLSFLKQNPIEANELTLKTLNFMARDKE